MLEQLFLLFSQLNIFVLLPISKMCNIIYQTRQNIEIIVLTLIKMNTKVKLMNLKHFVLYSNATNKPLIKRVFTR